MEKADVLHLDPERLRELFNLRGSVYESRGGAFEGDPYPLFHALRESGPVHEGIPGPLIGFHGDAHFQGLPFPERPHFSVFDFTTCDAVFRDGDTFSSSTHAPGSEEVLYETTILYMNGERHHRYRSLVQPSFVPKRAQWWVDNWIHTTVDALIDTFVDNGRADLNIGFFAPIPLLTICGSFGVSVPDALDIRTAVTSDGLGMDRFMGIVAPIISERRREPADDLISVLVQAEVTDEDGTRHVLTDEEILGFAFILLAAGSGTTWKQMGITLLALLQHPDWLDHVRDDPAVLRNVIEESLRWMPTDPVFARFTTQDVTLQGVDIPAGSVVHMCLASSNRDPKRWDRPDEFDPSRPLQSHLGFGSGSHICIGMHVARAEIRTAITALIDRLPDLRLDRDAVPPRITGMYERGPTSVPVLWGDAS
jgi:cytochrome P450